MSEGMSEHQVHTNVSSEHKNNVHKLYRYAQQLVQRLDLQLQNAAEWKEFFDSEIILIRQKLKDTCEQLLFHGNVDIARRTEDVLWRKAFYDLIQKLRQDKRTLQNNPVLFALYSIHLSAAHSFYHQLLIKIKDHFDLPITSSLDWLSALEHKKRKTKEAVQNKVRKDTMEWAMKACQRCLLYLGDIARYSMDVGDSAAMDLAERFYHHAIWVNPENGMPHNQLGTLKQQANFNNCEVAYHYMRCLASVNSFDGAEENLKRTFERNRLSKREATEKLSGERVNIIEDFLFEFLELQEHFRYERLSSSEFSRICQSVIEKFTDTLNLNIWKTISPGKDLTASQENYPMIDETQRINGTLMVKIFVICIITVSDLFQRESTVISAAVAFMFTMLSKFLDFFAKVLSESPLSINISANESGQSSLQSSTITDSDNALCNGDQDASLKMKKRRVRMMQNYRLRRRRRKPSSENEESDGNVAHHEDDFGSDLSEGELASRFSSSSSDDDSDLSSTDEFMGTNATKRRREEDHNKIRSLCEVGRILSAQIQESSFGEASPSPVKRDALWRNGLHPELHIDATLGTSLSYFTEICYLHAVKIVIDWLRYAGDRMGIYEKDLSCVWQKVAKALNELPSHQLLISVLQSSKRKRSFAHMVELKDPFHNQEKALPEDKSLIGLPILMPFHKTLDYDWDSRASDVPLLQFVIRIQALKAFGNFLAEKVESFSCSPETEKFSFGVDVPNGSCSVEEAPREVVGLSGNSQKISRTADKAQKNNGKNQAEFMKALAKQKLMHEVNELQDRMDSTNLKEASNLPPYLIVDSQALCRHLSLIRSLSKSREFIIIVPIQVVQALDELKRYNPSAREAIKFLEEEFRQQSKWLRSQRDEETRDVEFSRTGKKKKNLTIEEWRFHQIVKCSAYFASKHSKTDVVSIVTARTSNESSGTLGTRATQDALDSCRKLGIEVEPLVDFYQRWVAKKHT